MRAKPLIGRYALSQGRLLESYGSLRSFGGQKNARLRMTVIKA